MRVFISYHSRDRETVRRLVSAIKAVRPAWEPFFDEQSLTTGYWMPQLADGVARADAFLFLFGEKLGPWQTIEYYGAFDRRVKEPKLPITPVLTGDAGAPGLPFFSQLQWAQEKDPTAPDAVARIVSALERTDASEAKELWRLVDPYRGLKALREEDAALLHGREEVVADLVEAVAQPSGKVLVAVGNSGVGKSSLLFAGVFAALSHQGWPRKSDRTWPAALSDSRSWLRLFLSPREDPLKQLARAFVAQWLDPKEAAYHDKVDEWAARLKKPGATLDELVSACDAGARDRSIDPPRRYVLYIDQGEELYARSEKEAAGRFSALLAAAAQDDRMRVLMSLRSDFYGRLQDDHVLFAASRKIDIPRLNETGIREVILGPAATFGATFEPGIADKLVKATLAAPSGLPLLSYQMEEMWDAMVQRGDGVLKLPTPESFDIASALIERADGYLKAHSDKEDATRRLFCTRLVHVPAQGAPTRQVALQTNLTEDERAVVDVLSGGEFRLITTGENDRGEATAEIGHETLLTSWERLRTWIGDRRGFYAWLTNLASVRRDYDDKPDRKALLQGRPLEIARANLALYPADVPEEDRKFIDKSDKAERNEERTAALFGWAAGILILFVAIGFLALGLFGIDRSRVALDSQSRVVARHAMEEFSISSNDDLTSAELKTRWETGMLLALEAWRDEGMSWWSPMTRWMAPERVEASSALRLALGHDAQPSQRSSGYWAVVNTYSVSPDGRLIATTGDDGALRVWDIATSKETLTVGARSLGFTSARFMPDGKQIMAWGDEDAATLFDASDGKVVRRFVLPEPARNPSVWFSRNGRWLMTSIGNGYTLWDVQDGKQVRTYKADVSGSIPSISFSRDGSKLLSTLGRKFEVMDTATGAVLGGFASEFYALIATTSLDEQFAILRAPDNAVSINNALTGEQLHLLTGHTSAVTGAVLSYDGQRLLTTSDDGTTRLWNTATGKSIHVFRNPPPAPPTTPRAGGTSLASSVTPPPPAPGPVKLAPPRVVFSADGQRLIVSLTGKPPQVWDAIAGTEVQAMTASANAAIDYGQPGGQLVLRAGCTISVWQTPATEKPAVVRACQRFNALDMSADGQWLVSAADEGPARLFDASTGAEQRTFGDVAVRSARFTPDGAKVMIYDIKNALILWDTATGKPIRTMDAEHAAWPAAFSQDGGRVLVLGSKGAGAVLDVQTGKAIITLEPDQKSYQSGRFSSDGRLVQLGDFGGVWQATWDASTGKLIPSSKLKSYQVLSPDGAYIADYGEADVKLLDAGDGTTLQVLKGLADYADKFVFSPDGLLAAGMAPGNSDSGQVVIWNLETNAVLHRFSVPSDYFSIAKFSENGDVLLSVDGNGLTQLWDVATGAEFQRIQPRGRPQIEDAILSRDGKRLLLFGGGWSLWNVGEGLPPISDGWGLATLAREKATRCLTRDERTRYSLDPEQPAWCSRFPPEPPPEPIRKPKANDKREDKDEE